MENNVQEVRSSEQLRRGARELMHRQVGLARILLAHVVAEPKIERAGRKAQHLEAEKREKI